MRSHIVTLFQNSHIQAENEESEIRAEERTFIRHPRNRNRAGSYRVVHESVPMTEVSVCSISRNTYDDLWLSHENHWKNFSASPPRKVFFDEIPFPPCDEDVLEFTARLNRLDRNMKAAYRLACKRFHPDKFMQTFGSSIADTDADRILSRLTAITQCINTQYASSKRLRRVSSEPPR